MQKETYNRLLNERFNEIQEKSKKINYNNLTYYFKDPRSSSISFIILLKFFMIRDKKIIDWVNDNARTKSESISKSKENETFGTRLKILTPKQMLQRLPIALVQV